jgi:hypothetical protein
MIESLESHDKASYDEYLEVLSNVDYTNYLCNIKECVIHNTVNPLNGVLEPVNIK